MVRWSLLHGVITRKTSQDDPTEGRELSVKQVSAIRKTTATTARRLPLAWPIVGIGALLAALAWWVSSLPIRIVAGLLGVVFLSWGVARLPAQKTVHEAYQIVAPGVNPEDWLVVGSTAEILGFIEGVQSEMRQQEEAAGSGE